MLLQKNAKVYLSRFAQLLEQKFLDNSTVLFGFIEYFFEKGELEFYACNNKIKIIQTYFAITLKTLC